MEATRNLLFDSVRYAVLGAEKPDLSAVTLEELRSLYSLSKAQDVGHIVGFVLEGASLPEGCEEAQKAFSKQHLTAVYRYQQLNFEYKRICKTLSENKIEYMPLKGSVIRAYYPKPWMRTSCDIDILVREADLDRARETLCRVLNYTDKGRVDYHDVSLFAPSGVHLELHFNIRENTEPMDGVLDTVWEHSRVCEGEYGYRQTDEFLLFHQIAHAAYHFTRGGCGLRPLLDIWLLRRALAVDSAVLDGLLAQAGLTEFAREIYRLSDVWYSGEAHTDLTRQMEDFILGAGIYGSSENRVAVKRAEKDSKFGYIMTRIFMPYSSMKHRFPILKRWPILLPFCHIVRWFGLLSPKRRRAARLEMKYNATLTGERTDKIGKMLAELGFKDKEEE